MVYEKDLSNDNSNNPSIAFHCTIWSFLRLTSFKYISLIYSKCLIIELKVSANTKTKNKTKTLFIKKKISHFYVYSLKKNLIFSWDWFPLNLYHTKINTFKSKTHYLYKTTTWNPNNHFIALTISLSIWNLLKCDLWYLFKRKWHIVKWSMHKIYISF